MLLVARIHHAVVYEIPTAAAPENAIAKSKKFRVSDGLSTDLVSVDRLAKRRRRAQVAGQVVISPVLGDDRSHCKDWDRQQVIVEHRVPIRETGSLDFLPHCQYLYAS